MASVLMYVALAYSHDDPTVVEKRVNQFLDLDAILIENGNVTVSPISKHFILNRGRKIPGDWRYWENYSCKLLKKCDMMVIATDIDGWKESTGVKGEVRFALRRNISIRGVDQKGNFHNSKELQSFIADCGNDLVVKPKKKFTYEQGWNACCDEKKYDTKAYPAWQDGYNDCLALDFDDRIRLNE